MNNLRNKVQLIGNLGKDPEVKKLESGRSKASFSLATTSKYRDQGGDLISDTQWHNIVAWGKKAEFAEQYLTKGKEIALEGKLVHRVYDDKNGEKKYITEVVMEELVLLGNKPKDNGSEWLQVLPPEPRYIRGFFMINKTRKDHLTFRKTSIDILRYSKYLTGDTKYKPQRAETILWRGQR